jgi:FG-GAP-like repeat
VFFNLASNFPAGVGPGQSATGDFNRDGRLDLAVTNQNTNSVSILLGNGNGTFGAPTNFAAGTSPRSLAVGDFNGDRSQDLVLVNAFSANVSILLGNGNGTFGAATNFTVGLFPSSVAGGDLTGMANRIWRWRISTATTSSSVAGAVMMTLFVPASKWIRA